VLKRVCSVALPLVDSAQLFSIVFLLPAFLFMKEVIVLTHTRR